MLGNIPLFSNLKSSYLQQMTSMWACALHAWFLLKGNSCWKTEHVLRWLCTHPTPCSLCSAQKIGADVTEWPTHFCSKTVSVVINSKISYTHTPPAFHPLQGHRWAGFASLQWFFSWASDSRAKSDHLIEQVKQMLLNGWISQAP